MRDTKGKSVLTTGEVARICHVAPRTVSKWFDTGQLRGYRIPGSRDRRIPVEHLEAFMRTHGIPLGALDGGTCRVLIMHEQAEQAAMALGQTDRYRVITAANDFEAGALAQQMHPHVIILDVGKSRADAIVICSKIKATPSLQSAKVIATTDQADQEHRDYLERHGFDLCLVRPYTAAELRRAVESVTNLIG